MTIFIRLIDYFSAPNLKGRPRKKRLNFHKLNGGDSSDSDSSSLDKSFSGPTIVEVRMSGEAILARVTHNLLQAII